MKKQGDLEYFCQKCDFVTNKKSKFFSHSKTHDKSKLYKCEICGKACSQKSNLKTHMIVHNAGYATKHSCSLCDFVTKYKQSLVIHQRMHAGIKPFKCTECDRSFSQSTHRRTHIQESHGCVRRFQCEVCGKWFKRQDHLIRHQLFHKNERHFKCDVCGAAYNDPKYLKQHKRIHLGDAGKTYHCDRCPYRSFFKQTLDVHYRLHTGVRPFSCQTCSRTFVTSGALKLHERMRHGGDAGRIFQCDTCEFRTANKQSLKLHVRRIHLGLKVDKKAECKECGLKYSSSSALYAHRKRLHSSKLRKEKSSYKSKTFFTVSIQHGDSGSSGSTKPTSTLLIPRSDLANNSKLSASNEKQPNNTNLITEIVDTHKNKESNTVVFTPKSSFFARIDSDVDSTNLAFQFSNIKKCRSSIMVNTKIPNPKNNFVIKSNLNRTPSKRPFDKKVDLTRNKAKTICYPIKYRIIGSKTKNKIKPKIKKKSSRGLLSGALNKTINKVFVSKLKSLKKKCKKSNKNVKRIPKNCNLSNVVNFTGSRSIRAYSSLVELTDDIKLCSKLADWTSIYNRESVCESSFLSLVSLSRFFSKNLPI